MLGTGSGAKASAPSTAKSSGPRLTGSEKQRDTRMNNIIAAKAVSDVVRTSLGPRGMDKMIQDSNKRVLITNDGATILKQMEVVHPTARMVRLHIIYISLLTPQI